MYVWMYFLFTFSPSALNYQLGSASGTHFYSLFLRQVATRLSDTDVNACDWSQAETAELLCAQTQEVCVG